MIKLKSILKMTDCKYIEVINRRAITIWYTNDGISEVKKPAEELMDSKVRWINTSGFAHGLVIQVDVE